MSSVTLCIPAYEAAEFVGDAIDSALAQTHGQVEVLIGVDASDDDTARVCLAYAGDPRVSVVVHEQRQGWADNCNSLLDRVTTDMYAFVFHDDRIEPQFCEVLVDLLDHNPDAVLASGALRLHGAADMVRRFEEVRGDTMQRLVTALTVPEATYSMKSLARSELVRQGLRLRADHGAYHADYPFFVAHAAAGEAVFVDEVLYVKRIWEGSVTAGWRGLAPDDLFERRVSQLGDVHRIVAALDLPPQDKRVLHALGLARGVGGGVTEHLPTDTAAATHDLRTAAAVIAHLLGEPTSFSARPPSAHMEDLARGLAVGRHQLGLAAMDRDAGHAVVAALHTLATTDDLLAPLATAEHVRVGRALQRGHDGHELADLALRHGRAVPPGDREHAHALVVAIRAHAACQRWQQAAELFWRLQEFDPTLAGQLHNLQRRIEAAGPPQRPHS